jgi:hypothetical protein
LTNSSDWIADIQESLWACSQEHGFQLSAADQVSITRVIARNRTGAVTEDTISEAFKEAHVALPRMSAVKQLAKRINSMSNRENLLSVLLRYRKFAIRNLSRAFGGKITGQESKLRLNLVTYLPEQGYMEAHTGHGQTDILFAPPTNAIIEVKVWTTETNYEDGLSELERYIQTEAPSEAHFVLFADRENLPSIVSDRDQEIIEVRTLGGLKVSVILVPLESLPPSAVGRAARKAAKDSD